MSQTLNARATAMEGNLQPPRNTEIIAVLHWDVRRRRMSLAFSHS